ncbi:tgb2 [Potexvirus ecsallii]|uniref:Tgb2 n=1 Tax=Potexvirus ecsallii TaxID=317027 RepID=C0L9E3_9VIRU|nr:tgb2 [Allium virus X]ACN58196.1 tgb2 [Allium virus X]
MSSAPIHLTPPPDHSKVFISVVVGVSIALCVFLLNKNYLPHVGDNLHSLPHGGTYCDGTKSINYRGPSHHTSSTTPLWAVIATLTLPLAIFLLNARRTSHHSTLRCGHAACASGLDSTNP